jgi:hypothetical protein
MNHRLDRQRGWAGLLALLLALAIVAWLARDALHKYGMVPTTPGVAPAAGPGTAGESEPAPRSPLDAARGLESTLRQQEDKRSGGY